MLKLTLNYTKTRYVLKRLYLTLLAYLRLSCYYKANKKGVHK